AAEAFFKAGELQKQGGGDALALFERALKLDATHAASALAVGRGYLAANRAADAIAVLAPFVQAGDSKPEFRESYARGLLAAGKTLEAEPFIRELYAKDPAQIDEVVKLLIALLDSEQTHKAVDLA